MLSTSRKTHTTPPPLTTTLPTLDASARQLSFYRKSELRRGRRRRKRRKRRGEEKKSKCGRTVQQMLPLAAACVAIAVTSGTLALTAVWPDIKQPCLHDHSDCDNVAVKTLGHNRGRGMAAMRT